jgi:hypothetical protein
MADVPDAPVTELDTSRLRLPPGALPVHVSPVIPGHRRLRPARRVMPRRTTARRQTARVASATFVPAVQGQNPAAAGRQAA